MGEAKGNEHTYGKIVKSLIDEGGQLGVSSRGMVHGYKERRQLCRKRLLFGCALTLLQILKRNLRRKSRRYNGK